MNSKCTLILAAAAIVLTSAAIRADDPPAAAEAVADIEGTRALLDQWVKTRRLISKEKSDWRIGRQMLEERVELVQDEIDSLREKITDTEQDIADADERLAGLVQTRDALEARTTGLAEIVKRLEAGTRTLLARLPDEIRDRVKPLSQKLPDEGGEVKVSIGERYLNVVGIVNEVTKFNQQLTTASEVRTLPDGTTVEVTALYVGISCGYYVNDKQDLAGIGMPSPVGWTWTTANEAAPAIARAIAVLSNDEVAGFVQLPVTIE